MTRNKLIKQLKKTEPTVYKTYGKLLNNPETGLDTLVRHYQWIYQFGDYHNNDMGSNINTNYKLIFVHLMENNKVARDKFLNHFIKSIKIAFDQKLLVWDKEVIINILVHNRSFFWYDLLAMYTLIAGNYDEIRPFINDMNIDETISIPSKLCAKLFDLIITNDFADQLIKSFVLDRENTSKSK